MPRDRSLFPPIPHRSTPCDITLLRRKRQKKKLFSSSQSNSINCGSGTEPFSLPETPYCRSASPRPAPIASWEKPIIDKHLGLILTDGGRQRRAQRGSIYHGRFDQLSQCASVGYTAGRRKHSIYGALNARFVLILATTSFAEAGKFELPQAACARWSCATL